MATARDFWTGIQMLENRVQTARTLLETYQANVFNERTRGAITMGTRRLTSTIGEEFAWDRLTSKGVFRDPTEKAGSPADQYLNQFSTKRVKMGFRYGPDILDISTADWKGIPFERLGSVRGAQIASYSMSLRAQVAVSALVGAFSNSDLSGLLLDRRAPAGTASSALTAAHKMSIDNLLDAQAILGDQWESIRVWVMHSRPFHDLLKASATNTNRLFNIGNIGITSLLGKTFIVTDNPQLIVGQSGSGGSLRVRSYYTLGLKANACRVDLTGEFRQAREEVLGEENLKIRVQAQDTIAVGVANMQYNKTTAPTGFAALGNGDNWSRDIETVDLKDYFGVRLQTS